MLKFSRWPLMKSSKIFSFSEYKASMSKPTVQELDQCLQDLIHWERFAIYLPGLEQRDVDTIRKDKRDDTIDQKLALYETWLQVYPSASWKNVLQALRKVKENALAKDIEARFLVRTQADGILLQLQPSEEENEQQKSEMGRVKVSKDVVENLEKLDADFKSLTKTVKSEIENDIESERKPLKHYIRHTEEEKAFEIEFRSVQTTDQFFKAIRPHYNFLDCYLIISLALLLSNSIACRAKTYKKKAEKFMKKAKVESLRQMLEPYFPITQSNDRVKVLISLENSWGKQSIWVVKQLVVQLFSLEHPDQCQWFRIISGSLLTMFLAAKYLEQMLVENSKKKAQFMRLMGIRRLEIGEKCIHVPTDDERLYKSSYILIRATIYSSFEAVQFVLQHVNVNIDFQFQGCYLSDLQDLHEQCNDRLLLIRHSFSALEWNIYDSLKEMLTDGRVTLQTLLAKVEAEFHLPLSAETIKTADDFIQTIQCHYSFLNCHLLVILASTLSDSLENEALNYENSTIYLKKTLDVKLLQSLSYDIQVFQPAVTIEVTIKLEDVWLSQSLWLVEMLIQKIFFLKLTDEFQWFRVVRGSINVVFLVAKHKMMRLIVNSVKKRQLMEHTGVISLKVGRVYTFLREEEVSFSIKEAIAHSHTLHDPELADFLQSFEEDHPIHYPIMPDKNRNYVIVPEKGSTALMIACSNDDFHIAQLLLENKADPNIQNERKYTALMYASRNYKLVKLLFAYNADVNSKNFLGETLLHFASMFGNVRVIEMLLETNLNMKQREGKTPIFLASEHGHVQVVKQLLQAKVDPNVQEHSGMTPLHIASQEGYVPVVKQLLQAKVDSNVQEHHRMTPLYMASQEGHVQVVKQLLQAKVDLSVQEHNGMTPLHIASQEGYVQVVEQLLQAKADHNIQDSLGRTALYIAVAQGHSEVVEQLLRANANPNILNVGEISPLCSAVFTGNFKAVELLLEAGVNPNFRLKDGTTPLHIACAKGYLKIVELLLHAKANPNVRNRNRCTPLDLARHSGHFQVAEKLQKTQAGFSQTD